MIRLFLTIDHHYAHKTIARCGLKDPWVLVRLGTPRYDTSSTYRVGAPLTGYFGCVRSVAFLLQRPVLVQVGGERYGHLVMPLRTHPADMAKLEMWRPDGW